MVLHIHLQNPWCVFTYWSLHAGLDFFLKREKWTLKRGEKASNEEYSTTSIYENMKFTDRFHIRRNTSEQYPRDLYNLEQCGKECRLFILFLMVEGIRYQTQFFNLKDLKKFWNCWTVFYTSSLWNHLMNSWQNPPEALSEQRYKHRLWLGNPLAVEEILLPFPHLFTLSLGMSCL